MTGLIRKNVKGSAWLTIIIIIALVIVIAVILLKFLGGFGLSGGKGDETDSGNASESISTSIDESEIQTTFDSTTEELLYLNITISENDYIYQNQKIALEELMNELEKRNDILQVKITDDNASQKAYNKLTKALDEKNIDYFE